MSKREDKIEIEAIIIKSLPGGRFDVRLADTFGGGGVVVHVYMSWKMRKNLISLIEGDTVLVELTPYDLTKGRIVFRKK